MTKVVLAELLLFPPRLMHVLDLLFVTMQVPASVHAALGGSCDDVTS
jgi:hypothetical protein